MEEIRKPAVASMFYPDDTINLKRMINQFISNVPADSTDFFKKNAFDNIFSIIVPHAGYIYSGQVAAYSYSLLKQKEYDTIVLIGPSHFTYFEGFALPYYKCFETPLGKINLDQDLLNQLVKKSNSFFDYINTAHIKEHSLEVQLPFLQSILTNDFQIVPILMGEQSYKNALEAAETLYEVFKNYDKHFLFVISTDLSHYHSDEEARSMDNELITTLSRMDAKKLLEESKEGKLEACGIGPIAVVLELARLFNRTKIKVLVYKNSGETSNDYERVVGYLSAAVW